MKNKTKTNRIQTVLLPGNPEKVLPSLLWTSRSQFFDYFQYHVAQRDAGSVRTGQCISKQKTFNTYSSDRLQIEVGSLTCLLVLIEGFHRASEAREFCQ